MNNKAAVPEGLLTTQVVKVTRSTAYRLVPYGAFRDDKEAYKTLPVFEHSERGSTYRYAITVAYVEHTWGGSSWHTRKVLTGVKLTKAGEAWGGYPREHGILFYERDTLPDDVQAFFDSEQTPTTRLILTEVEETE